MDSHRPRSLGLAPDHLCDNPEQHMRHLDLLRDPANAPDLVLMLLQELELDGGGGDHDWPYPPRHAGAGDR